jgi:hypothetical protein
VSFSCVKHPMAMSEFVCGQCGHEFCPECVVFPYGVDKPPVCISCALQIAGISKRPTGRPKLGRRAVKRRLKAERRAPASATSSTPASGADDDTGHDDERWMDGHGAPEEFPGGWKQTF